MNCKPGQPAYIHFPGVHYGKVVRVTELDYMERGMWLYEGTVLCQHNGERYVALRDDVLTPLSNPGDSARDNAWDWLPAVPTKELA